MSTYLDKIDAGFTLDRGLGDKIASDLALQFLGRGLVVVGDGGSLA